jgi:putative Holliday junction resolvase
MDARNCIMALDVGARRIGIAVSDGLGITAQGLRTLERRNRPTDLEALRILAAEHGVGRWLLGLPRHLSGDEGRQAEKVRAWGEALAAHTRLPVTYWDERLTTVEAGRVLTAAGSSLGQRKKAIDRLSAVILLQSFLEASRPVPGNNDSEPSLPDQG